MNPLAFAFGLKPMAIAVAIALSIGGVAGWRTKGKLDDGLLARALVQAYTRQLKTLQGRIDAANTAATKDEARAAEAERNRSEAEGRAHELEQTIADGACYSAADTDELRKLWTRPGGAQGRSAARSR